MSYIKKKRFQKEIYTFYVSILTLSSIFFYNDNLEGHFEETMLINWPMFPHQSHCALRSESRSAAARETRLKRIAFMVATPLVAMWYGHSCEEFVAISESLNVCFFFSFHYLRRRVHIILG